MIKYSRVVPWRIGVKRQKLSSIREFESQNVIFYWTGIINSLKANHILWNYIISILF